MTEYRPSGYSSYRIKKAKETLDEVKNHIENGF